jgi:hypothetical protein
MGIFLTENILDRNGSIPIQYSPQLCKISTPEELVEMSRDEIIELSRINYNDQTAAISDLYLILPQLALSYARMDDLQAVAALLKLSAVYNVQPQKVEDAWNYVLLQQNSNGSFGLLAAEIMLLGQENNIAPYLMMTTEVLQAIASAGLQQGLHNIINSTLIVSGEV